MADEAVAKSKTTSDILGESAARDVLQEIFADLNPGLIDETRDIRSIFTPQSAKEFLGQLMDLTKYMAEEDTYEVTVQKLQTRIDAAEQVRDSLLQQVFKQIRPIERSYRELMLFFENSKVPDGKVRKPIQLFVFNADARAMQDVFSMTLAAIETFCRNRNDNFNFRDDICNLVVPGLSPQQVREKLEDIANTWGMLLVSDTDDEKSFRNVDRNFLPGGKYEFMKRPEDRAASEVVLMGYLQLRPKHWFEKEIDGGDDLYGPPSLVFAGAVARTDDAQGLAQGPIGSRFGQIAGGTKCRIEPLIGEMEHIRMEREHIHIIRV